MKEMIKSVPSKPGVYIFKDDHEKILYVGKAINLKHRVASYFSSDHVDRPWIKVMIGLIKTIETTIVTNELEALMLEATIIKDHHPKFNIKLTDDKSYPYIVLHRSEAIPRFSIQRSTEKLKSVTLFGPYLSARSARFSLEFLRDLYGIHISQKALISSKSRRCFHCELSGHLCPLAGEISQESYEQKVKLAVDFLRGKRKTILKDLRLAMEIASNNQNFEKAARLRDRLQAGEQVIIKQVVIGTTSDDYDTIEVAVSGTLGSVSLLYVRDGRVVSQSHFFVECLADSSEKDVLRNFLITYYPSMETSAKRIVLNESIEELNAIEALISEQTGRAFTVTTVKRGEKNNICRLAKVNAETKLEMHLIGGDQRNIALVSLKNILGLPDLPRRIEAIDISNLGASEPVGACVCFINGEPDKNEYRRYIIKTVEGQNDFAMIREVVNRRLSDTSRILPDLLVIDGGKEQLKFALAAAPLDLSTKIISLAKKPDRIFSPNRQTPLSIKKGEKGLLLLGRIRDEVHRFGLSFQRSRQRKKSLKG